MTLLELTEPLFQYICRLNRLARRSVTMAKGDTASFARGGSGGSNASSALALDYAVVRSEIKVIFEEMFQRAGSDMKLSQQIKQMELPLLFFVDSMIAESTLMFAGQWNQNRLAYERNELAGDEKFFDLLEETAKDSGEDASDRLAIYYVCLGLGFTGIYFKQPEYLRRTMLTIAPRIRHLMDADQAARICPEAYENVDTRNLVQPPGARLVFVGILFVCLMVAVLVAYGWMYHMSSSNLKNLLPQIREQDSQSDTIKK